MQTEILTDKIEEGLEKGQPQKFLPVAFAHLLQFTLYFEKGDKNDGGEEESEKNDGEDGEAGVEQLFAPYKAESPKEHGKRDGNIALECFVLSHGVRELKDGFG